LDHRKVWILEHCHELDGCDDIKRIGIFSSAENAQRIMNQLRNAPGFNDYPDGFTIDMVELDTFEWATGFVLEPDAED